ncbi:MULTISPECIES: type II toxin-antitoxin system RelE/ParE family toxin [unclassified Mesorhizobium]|uniref:type II toxin-antitoxin system RelE/ParE family toxin n=1 Tax=unclassified Mesorhizobium TaxID=325217 RepID=UPI001FDA3B72
MEHRIVFHPKAETELDQLYDDIATRASPAIAWNFVVGIRDHCLSVSTFPQCGTERVEIMPGPRIIGWRRAVSIAFAVDAERVWSWVFFRRQQHHGGIAGRPALKRCLGWRGDRHSPGGDSQADGTHLPPPRGGRLVEE